jgi:hypothetical protein
MIVCAPAITAVIVAPGMGAPEQWERAIRSNTSAGHFGHFGSGASRTRPGGLLGAIQGAQRLNVAILQGCLAVTSRPACRQSLAVCGNSLEFWHVAGSACQNLGQLSRPEGRAGVDVLVDPPLPLAAGSVAVTEALGELGRAVGLRRLDARIAAARDRRARRIRPAAYDDCSCAAATP